MWTPKPTSSRQFPLHLGKGQDEVTNVLATIAPDYGCNARDGILSGSSLFVLDNRRVAGVKVDARAGFLPGLKVYMLV